MTDKASDTSHLAAALDSETLVNMLLSQVESEGKTFDTLDSKAGLILGFGLVGIGEIAGFLLLATSEAHQPRAVSCGVRVFFYLGMVLIMAGAASAMWALYPRGFSREIRVITAETLENPPKVVDVLKHVLEVKDGNQGVLKLKADWTRAAGILVVAGLFCLAGVTLLLFRSLFR